MAVKKNASGRKANTSENKKQGAVKKTAKKPVAKKAAVKKPAAKKADAKAPTHIKPACPRLNCPSIPTVRFKETARIAYTQSGTKSLPNV